MHFLCPNKKEANKIKRLYLKEGKLPDWEVPNMLAKYYTTTAALDLAKSKTK